MRTEHAVADIVTRYIATIALTSTGLPNRPWPIGPGPINYLDLESLLNNPANLAGFATGSSRDRLESLVNMAVWLRDAPTGAVPLGVRSRAARFRFLVWSLPFRLRAAGFDDDVLPGTADIPFGDVPRSVALETDQLILVYAREAREDWLGHLNTWEDDPWLATASGRRRLEDELRLLTETWPSEKRIPSGPLELVERDANKTTRRDDHRRVAADIGESHWLPRGAVLWTLRGFWPARWRAWLLLPSLVVPLISVAVMFGLGWADTRWVALGVVAAGMLGVVALPPDRRDSLVLLRLPATVGVGALVLLSLTPRWWLDPGGWRVGAGLAGAALLYLMVESRLHGTRFWRAIGRGGLLGFVGLLYSIVVCLVMFGFVVPSLGEHGECLAGWWNYSPWQRLPWPAEIRDQCVEELHSGVAAAPAGILALMVGWSLAVGLVAQILWDDRPVTAPLGRLRRVRGGRS